MQPTIPITSGQYVSFLEGTERQAPGITHAEHDSDGVIIFDDDDA